MPESLYPGLGVEDVQLPIDQWYGGAPPPDAVSGPPGPFRTTLSAPEEQEFQQWQASSGVPYDPSPTSDYDMRGYWKAQKSGDPNAKTAVNQSDQQPHFPDTYKTPYHQTLSNESIYAPPDAPHWENDRLVDARGNIVADESVPGEALQPTPGADGPLFPWDAPASLQGHPQAGEHPGGLGELVAPLQQAAAPIARPIEDAYATQKLAHDPEALAIAQSKAASDAETERGKQVAAAESGLREAQTEYKKANLAAAAKMAQVDADSQKAGDHWWATRTTGQKVAAYISAAFGALLALKRGGKNEALDNILNQMKEDTAQQMELLKQRRGAIHDLYQQSGDLYQAKTTYQMGQLANVEQTVRSKMAELDPRGTQIRAGATLLQAVLQKKEAARIEAEDKMLKREHEAAELRVTMRGQSIAAGTARRGQNLEGSEHHLIPDGRGGWKTDPTYVAPPDLKTEHDKALIGEIGTRKENMLRQMGEKRRERAIDFRGGLVGMAKSEKDSAIIKDKQEAYDLYQKEMVEVTNMARNPDGSTKHFYFGPGWQSTPDKERDALLSKAKNLVYIAAKLADPAGSVKDQDVDFFSKVVPFAQGWSDLADPQAKADALLHTADSQLDASYDSRLVGGLARRNEPDPNDTPEVQAAFKSVGPAAPTASDVWKATRSAAEAQRKEAQKPQTGDQSKKYLEMPLAAGSPPAAAAEYVTGQIGTLERLKKDQPWMVLDIDAGKLKEGWDKNEGLSDDQKTQLKGALDETVEAVQLQKVADPLRFMRAQGLRKADPAWFESHKQGF